MTPIATLPAALFFGAGAGTIVVTEWLRHRAHRRAQGTQHIFLIGYSIAMVLVGIGAGVMVTPGRVCRPARHRRRRRGARREMRHHWAVDPVSAEGAVWCWGQNEFGALGDDTSIDRSLPVQPVGLPRPAIALSAGAGGTCAVLSDGDAYCWGSNLNGQLGDGTRIHRARPVKVIGLEGAGRMVSYGEEFSCATTQSLRALCWGKNDEGQLGDGSDSPREVPAPVQGF